MFSKLAATTKSILPTLSKRVPILSCGNFAHQSSNHSIFHVALASVLFAAALSSQQKKSLCEPCPHVGLPGTERERTFIAIKPDGVQRLIVGEIIARFEKKGYKLVAMKMIWPSKEKASGHYADLAGRPFFNGLVDYFSSGPIVAMVWEGPAAISTGRKMLGATNPLASEPGTIRGDFCVRVGRNIIHGSDGPESAQHEIGFWFSPEEVSDWDRSLDTWITADN